MLVNNCPHHRLDSDIVDNKVSISVIYQSVNLFAKTGKLSLDALLNKNTYTLIDDKLEIRTRIPHPVAWQVYLNRHSTPYDIQKFTCTGEIGIDLVVSERERDFCANPTSNTIDVVVEVRRVCCILWVTNIVYLVIESKEGKWHGFAVHIHPSH